MKIEVDIPEHHYNNIMTLDSVSLGRVPYKGILMYSINAIKHGKVLEQEPTAKNDLGVDCVDRQTAIDFCCENTKLILRDTASLETKLSADYIYENVAKIMRNPYILPSVTPQQEPITIVKIKYDEDKLKELVDKAVFTTVTPQEREVLDKILAEIKEWYWQADKQELAKDPCVVDAMIDLFIRTIDKYKVESEVEQ